MSGVYYRGYIFRDWAIRVAGHDDSKQPPDTDSQAVIFTADFANGTIVIGDGDMRFDLQSFIEAAYTVNQRWAEYQIARRMAGLKDARRQEEQGSDDE